MSDELRNSQPDEFNGGDYSMNNNPTEPDSNMNYTEDSYSSQSYQSDSNSTPGYSTQNDSDQNSYSANYSNNNFNQYGNQANNPEFRNEQKYNTNYNNTNFNPYGYSNQVNPQTYNTNPYTAYQPVQMNEVKKPKKKRKVFGVFKLTAAALAFGIVAGAAFQGYYLVMGVNQDIGANGKEIKVSQVSENSDNGTTVVPASTNGNSVATDVSDVVSKVMPSIVAINADVTSTNYDFFGNEVAQQAQSSGSGIIIAKNGSKLLIVTNNHVIEGANKAQIVFSDNSKAEAEIKGSDANADLAILSVNMNDLSEKTISTIKVATLGDSSKVEAGDMAIAIGNALGYGQSVTVGYISAVNREVDINNKTMKLLQTDAAINPGNSGGALLNSKGEVIGINSVKYASTEVEGMGYAIPISHAVPMIDELMNRQSISANEQGYLGIDASSAQNVTSDYSERFNMPIGVYVNDVIKNSPAEKAGLVKGDIITGVDDLSVATIDDLVSALSYKKAGQQIDLKIQVKNNGSYVEKTLKVTLGSKK